MTSIVRQVSMKNRKRVQHFKKLLCVADNVAVIALKENNRSVLSVAGFSIC